MFAIRDNKVVPVEIVKENNKGTGAWCKIEGSNKHQLISYSKMFETEEEANKVLNDKNKVKQNKEEKTEKEIKEIENIVFKIYNEFGIEIKFLDRPSTVEQARELYYKLKNEYAEELKNRNI